ncbi:PREDICTED: extracellular superoxide dismutase [Cu-Zn] [Condylura cristata]|uniref:extracellular superoxide dismutase [Cu-Zn] n=1 Tax=Condylura cristata TaxID=143302 RepID=UPI0003342D4D|nr:PREDICTED: extracellular superoxide dismutase [Cu-Zn] [Condylura cristata]
MLALLCAWLLLAAGADATGTGLDAAGLGAHTQEQIRDMYDKVTEIWQGLKLHRTAGIRADGTLHAACRVQPSASLKAQQPRVSGLVLFRQLSAGALLEAFFDLEGFPADSNASRAIHVHEFGDLSQGCEAAGPHYNPLVVRHPQHPGDFGNFAVRDGRVWKYRTGLAPELSGPHSIMGRALVVHEGLDDLGRGGNPASLEHGNAGPRLACCVVSACGPQLWARQVQEHAERRKQRRASECKTTA